ncbi:MAG: glutathione S-transferase family protein [Myxococcota bacterium]
MQLDSDGVTTREVLDWKGLHLLHFQASSCSQKVRILLAEKGLDWESHPVDLIRHENTHPWFVGINPRGVVPVLVHDGVVHIESNDILAYLDALPSEASPFFPQDAAEGERAKTSLELEDGLHMDLRTITMGFLVPATLAKKPPATLERFAQAGVEDEKRAIEVRWWRDFADQGITRQQGRASGAAFGRAFETLESWLADGEWLLGDRLSVLEIAWFISVHRLAGAGYPLERHPKLAALYARLLERPAFAREVESRGLPGLALQAYGWFRKLTGTTLREAMR